MIHRRRPLYSACTEDSESEIEALAIDERDTVVAIAAGGGRALSLLTQNPERLIAVDRRTDQLFQLELKAAAMDALDYEDYAFFLGLIPGGDRGDVYAEVRSGLSPAARRYWDRRRSLIQGGALYAGRAERIFSAHLRSLRRLGRFRWAARYFEARNLAEQHEMIAAEGRRLLGYGLLWQLYCHPLVVFSAYQDPGYLRSTQGSVGAYMHRRFVEYSRTNLFRDSYLLYLLYYGRYDPNGPLPIYLTPRGFDRAKKRLDRLELICSDVDDFASRFRSHERLKWSLSDISAWMSEQDFHSLLGRISVRGASGSRICARNFAARRSIPEVLQPRVRRLGELSRWLDQNDKSIFFRFEVAEYGPCELPART